MALWLCITTLYFLYIRNYKNIGQSWLLLLIVWYLLFTFSISIADLGITSPIVIGPGHTDLLLCLLLKKKYIFFENLVFQTVYILDEISLTLGCSIYIPVLPIFAFRKWFKKTYCAPSKKPDNNNNKGSLWWPKWDTRSPAQKDFDKCGDLADKLKQQYGILHKRIEVPSDDGKRIVSVSETWVPFYKHYSICDTRDMTPSERAMYNAQKPDSKKK